MKKFDFDAARKQAEKEGQVGSSDIFKVKEGDNRVRVMSELLPHRSTFKGEPNFKWLCYVLDRRDSLIKPYFMPHGISKFIGALQQSEDYSFDSVPMPYDITIHADGAGTKEVKYSVVPARTNTPVTPAELNELDKKKPLKELQAILRAKDAERNGDTSDGEPVAAGGRFDPDEIPF